MGGRAAALFLLREGRKVQPPERPSTPAEEWVASVELLLQQELDVAMQAVASRDHQHAPEVTCSLITDDDTSPDATQLAVARDAHAHLGVDEGKGIDPPLAAVLSKHTTVAFGTIRTHGDVKNSCEDVGSDGRKDQGE